MKSCVKTSVLQVTQTIWFFFMLVDYCCMGLLLNVASWLTPFCYNSPLQLFIHVHLCFNIYTIRSGKQVFSWEHCNCSKGCTDLIETIDMNVMEQLDRNEWNTNIVHTHWFIIYCITYHFDLTKRLSKYAKIFSWNKNKILYIGSIN